MTARGTAPDVGKLQLSDDDTEDLWASPSKKKSGGKASNARVAGSNVQSSQGRNGESHHDSEEAREEALRRELESVRNINRVIEVAVESLERAKGNMEVWMRSTSSRLNIY